MRIGQLAATTGVSRDGLRFYETKGLLTSHRDLNGYRRYMPESVDFVRYIRTVQRLGFSLGEISQHMRQIDRAADRDKAIKKLLRDRMTTIEQRIAELGELRNELQIRLKQTCPLSA